MPMSSNVRDHNDDDALESGEATSLLGKASPDADGSAAPGWRSYFPAAGATAPPPSAAPPPPPEDASHPNTTDAASQQEQQPTSTVPFSAQDDDSGSQAQLSFTHSTKSGKSGKSSKSAKSRKKKKKSPDAASTLSGTPHKKKEKRKEGPQKTMCHLLYDALRYLAIMASAMMMSVQMLPLVFFWGETTWLQVAVKSYLVIFCASFILTESNVSLLQRITFHNNWITRGFIYTFIGLVGMEQDLAIKVEEIAAGTTNVLGPTYGLLFATLFMSLTTWFMICVGGAYTLLGLLCLQGWYERLEEEHREKVQEWTQRKTKESARNQDPDREESEKERCEGKRREDGGAWYDDLG